MSSSPLVGVLTPVYNGEDYLDDACPAWSRRRIRTRRATIVDNASTDATPEIVAGFAGRDPRVRYLRFDEFVSAKETTTRPFRALDDDAAYCKILQADNWLYPDCLRLMVEAAVSAPSIGVVSAYQLFGTDIRLGGLPYTATVVKGDEIVRRTVGGHFNVTGSPTAILLRSDLVRRRDPFYEEDWWHDDTEAVLWALTNSDLAFVHQVLTFARRQPGSRLEEARALNAEGAEQIRFLLRYGPAVMEPEEYQEKLRQLLKTYVRYHVRKTARLSRSARRPSSTSTVGTSPRSSRRATATGMSACAMTAVRALLLRRALGAPWRRLRTAGAHSGRLLDAL